MRNKRSRSKPSDSSQSSKRRRLRSTQDDEADIIVDTSHQQGPANAHIILNTDPITGDDYNDEQPITRRSSQRSTLPVEQDDEQGEDEQEEEDDEIIKEAPVASARRPNRRLAVANLISSQADGEGEADENEKSLQVTDEEEDGEEDSEGEEEEEEEEEEEDRPLTATTRKGLATSGILSSIRLDRFMSHKCFVYELGPNVNILNGKNGSGKSAIVAALQLGLGGKANITDRGERLDKHITYGQTSAIITINILNQKIKDAADMTYKHDLYGDMIIIERKIMRGRGTGAGSSSWKVKGKGKAVNLPQGITHRREAFEIFHHFGFMVHNPVAFLTQDNSKKFLAKGKPTAHYKLYREATLLEPLQNQLTETYTVLRRIQGLLEKSADNRPAAKEKLRKYEIAHHNAQAMKNINQQIKDAAILMAWTEFAEHKGFYEDGLRLTREKYEPRASTARDNLDNAKEELDFTSKLVKEKDTETADVVKEQDIAAKARGIAEKAYVQVECEINSRRRQMQSLKRDVTDADRLIEREQIQMANARKSHFKGQEQKSRLVDDLRTAQSEEKELKTDMAKARDESSALESQRLDFKDEFSRLQEKNQRLQQDRDSKYRDFSQRQQESRHKNSLNRFGGDVPTIVDIIRKNQNKFQIPPVGPIGNYVKLKDESWATAIELGIQKSTLCSFLVTDSRDEKMLLSLLPRNIRRPFIYIVNMRAARYNVTSQTKPDAERYDMCTILDQITVENDTVFNALVDFANVEQLVLGTNGGDITELAWAHVPNVKSVWNKDGDHATSRGGSKVFRPNRNQRAHLLTRDMRRYLQSLKDEADQTNRDLEAHNREIEVQKRRDKEFDREVTAAKLKINGLSRELHELEKKRQKIEDQLNRAEDLFDPSPFEMAINQQNDRKAQIEEEELRLTEQVEQFSVQLEECKKTSDESRRTLAEKKGRAKALAAELQKLSDNQAVVHRKVKKLQSECDAAERKLAEAHGELERLKAKMNNSLEKAKYAGPEPINVDKDRNPSKTIERKIEMLYARLTAEKNRRGGKTADEIEEEYLRAQAQHDENERKVGKIKRYEKSIRIGLTKRHNNLKRLEKSLKKMVRFQFRRFLSTRGHSGDIKFRQTNDDNDGGGRGAGTSTGKKQELLISAKIASHDKGDGERHETKDLRSLSGGERSFTTLCFMMALAEICQNPLRVMDEIDVYQDEANRRASFKILVDFFQTYLSDRQVIIITPHSLPPNINSTQTCRIVKLDDPRREGTGQTRIDDFIESNS